MGEVFGDAFVPIRFRRDINAPGAWQSPPLAQPCSRVADFAWRNCGRAVFVGILKRQNELSVVS